MATSKINYRFKRGDTKALYKFNIKDADGNIISLTENDKIYFTVKNSNDVAIIRKNTDDGIELEDDGYYHITLSATDTEDLSVGSYRYDIELDLKQDDDTMYVRTIIEGKITLTEDITRKGDR